MTRTLSIVLGSSLAYFALTSVAWAGTITVQGNVVALDDVTQLPSVVGSALFDEAFSGDVLLDQYAAAGLTFHVGELGMMLPGVIEAGEVPDPGYTSPGIHFPAPIAGGGIQQGYILLSGAAATFSAPVTQFGLTAGGSATQHITVWDQGGVMIGQVTWTPEEGDAAFVGVDTQGVAIGLITVGSDDIWGGVPYDDLGSAARSDTWVWGVGAACQSAGDCLDDTWACTAHECIEGACAYSPTTEPCDDDNACTDTDTCSAGACAGVPIDCNDANVCTFDTCDPRVGCANADIEACCMTDEDCPEEGQTCLVGSNTCVGGTPGDSDGDTTTSAGDTTSDSGGETATGDETGPALDTSERGCSCSAREREGGASFGLLALVLLGGVRGRRRGMFES